MSAGALEPGVATTPPLLAFEVRRGEWRRTLWRAVRTRRGAIGLTLALAVVLVAGLGPAFAPHSGNELVNIAYSPPGAGAPLGGDTLGRDVLSRVLDGGWVLLSMSLAATVLGLVLGAAAGIVAAYVGGWPDSVIMRTVDVVLAFPQLVFALMLVSIAGPKVWLIVLAVGISHAPQVARVLRAATLDISERDFVKARELNGVSRLKIMTGEILPNLTSPLTVEGGLRLTYSIVVISGLSFLGFGQPPPAANWGYMISENRIGLTTNPWALIVPAALIALLTIGVNVFTDSVAQVAIGAEGRAEKSLLLEAAGEVEA